MKAKIKRDSHSSAVMAAKNKVSGLSKSKAASRERSKLIANLSELNLKPLENKFEPGLILCNPAGCSRG